MAGKARQQKLGVNANGNEQTYSNPEAVDNKLEIGKEAKPRNLAAK